MSYSVKMSKLDFYTFNSQFVNYASFVMIIIMFCFIGSSIVGLSITSAWFTALLSTNIFMIQEKNDLDRLYASLSLDLKNIILGRYIFIFANYFIALLFSIIVGIAANTFKNIPISFQEIIKASCLSLLIFILIICVQIPIYFRYGYTKAKVRCLIPYVFVLAVIILPSFTTAFSNIIVTLKQHPAATNAMCLFVSVMVFLVSYKVSVICYRKRK